MIRTTFKLQAFIPTVRSSAHPKVISILSIHTIPCCTSSLSPRQFVFTSRRFEHNANSPKNGSGDIKSITEPQDTPESHEHQRHKDSAERAYIPIKLIDSELEESFQKGGGPGGQKVNKTVNCVILKHKPSGIIVRSHTHRELHANRKAARTIMISKLDDYYNGDLSKNAQRIKKLQKKKATQRARARKKYGHSTKKEEMNDPEEL